MMHLKPAGYSGKPAPGFGGVQQQQDQQRFVPTAIRAQSHHPYGNFQPDSSRLANVYLKSPNLTNLHERSRLIEQNICDLIGDSAIAADEEQFQVALMRAREAQENLDSLRSILAHEHHQQQRSDSSMSNASSQQQSANLEGGGDPDSPQLGRETQPMTTCMNLFDLSIMVRSNLATQLRNTNHLGEALDIYTQLCRLVGNSSTDLAMGSIISTMSADYGGKGGGSSTDNSGGGQKVGSSRFYLYRFGMNIGNILFEMGEYQRALKYYRLTLDRLSSAGNHQIRMKLINNIAITLICMNDSKPTNDVITSLGQLLADNIIKRTTAGGANDISPEYSAINSNHHRYLLNMMVCLFGRNDLQSMVSILKNHINVGICQQYAKVVRREATDCSSSPSGLDKLDKSKLEELIRRKEAEIGRCLIQSCQLVLDLSAKRAQRGQMKLGLEFCLRLLKTSELYKGLALELKTSYAADLLLAKRGKLETAVRLLEQIHLEQQQQHQQAQHQAIANNYDRSRAQHTRSATIKRVGSTINIQQTTPPPLANATKPTSSCYGLPTTTATNCKSPQVLANSSLLNSFRMKPDQALEWAERCLELADEMNPNAGSLINLAACHCNMKNYHKAENCYKRALDVASSASANNNNNNDDGSRRSQAVECWIAKYNLILLNRKLNRNLDDLDKSVQQTALLMIDQVGGDGGGKNSASNQNQSLCLTKLLYNKMLLLPIQVAMLCQQSGMSKQSWLILSSLSKQQKVLPPEIHIYQSKLMSSGQFVVPNSGGGGGGDDDHSNRPAALANQPTPTVQQKLNRQSISLLQMGHRRHSYHLPLAERLIALHIDEFDYKAAEEILMDCIMNRCDQVKWYQMLAECYRRAADYKRAANVYKLAIDLFPLDTSCLRAMSKLTADLGLTEENQFYQTKLARVLKKLD